MVETNRRQHKLKDIVEMSQYWDAEDLLRNLDEEMQRLEQGMGHMIWDIEAKPVTRCLNPLPVTPKYETTNSEAEFKVRVRLPGVAKEDIDLRVHAGMIELYARQAEKACRPFYMSIDAPGTLDPETARMKLQKGFLEIVVLKVKKKRVRIQ